MATGKEDEDVEAQIDRLNEVIARTLEDARRATLNVDTSLAPDKGPYSSHRPSTCRGRLSISHAVDPGSVPESGEGSEYSVDSDIQEYLYAMELELERAEMKFEDIASREMRQNRRVVLSPGQVSSLIAGLQRLESGQTMEMQLGEMLLEVVCRNQANQNVISSLSPLSIPTNELSNPEVVSTLQDRIEGLLTPDIPLHADHIDDISAEISLPKYENELLSLRKQVQFLNPEGEAEAAIRKELDIAEEISLGVASGQDPKKLYVQLTLVEKSLLQLRGHKAMQEAGKVIAGIAGKMNWEEESRKLQLSKDRILADIMSKADCKPVKAANLPTPKPVIVSLETVSSAMDSPAASRIIDFDFLLDKRERETELRKRLESVEERVDKLRSLLKEQHLKLQRYRDTEKQLLIDKTRLKNNERRLQLYKTTLERQERELFAREQELAAKTDALRDEAAEIVGREDALEYLAIKAEALEQENHKITLENTLIALKRTEIESEKEEIREVRRLLEGQNRECMREREALEREKALVSQSKTELEGFLPLLRRFQAGN